jgi:glycosyltransferase involved in cell wall biosynthesis
MTGTVSERRQPPRVMISIVVISKDEPSLAGTLDALQAQASESDELVEVIVVDASSGRLDEVRRAHPSVEWIDFTAPDGVRISIPHQRNAGIERASGDVVVFTDAGCGLSDAWLARLTAPILAGDELVTAGPARSADPANEPYPHEVRRVSTSRYLDRAPTINLAFQRSVITTVGPFDERFAYGSDIDFSWRLLDHGIQIRAVAEAPVTVDWGTPRRRHSRAYQYGQAKARLYLKHSSRRRRVLSDDPITVIYPLFILGLPLTLVFPPFPLLLLVPAARAKDERASDVLADHLLHGLGVLSVVFGL